MIRTKQPNTNTTFGWISFSMCSLFLTYEFITRIMPSVLATKLLVTFHLSATELGFLSAITSYVYIVLQIPAAILISRVDFRFVLVISFLLTALATLWFGEANSLARLDVARAVLGVASATAWVGAFKAGKIYLPSRLFPQVSGNIGSIAMFSTGLGGIVLAVLFSVFWWPDVIIYYALLGFIVPLDG